jgi:pyruvate, orthophosphate dikinase
MASDGPAILVRSELTPSDIAELAAAAGALTSLGGRTSHAAVVARQMGKVCVVGCRALRLEIGSHQCSNRLRSSAHPNRSNVNRWR